MSNATRFCNVMLLFCAALFWSGAASALTMTLSPLACATATGIGSVNWNNPGRATTSDGNVATASVDGTTTRFLQCTDYGFTIPANATINGITVNVERRSSSTANGGSRDAAMRLVKAGTIDTTDRATATLYTTADIIEAHGSTTDLWGTTWTPADVNAANFGAAFAATKPSATSGSHSISVDHIQISVDYSISIACTPPANAPAGLALTCVCDAFGRTSLNPSTIYNANWIVSTSDGTGIVPSIVNPGYLRLTNNTGNNAKAATVPGAFPATGNYISVEFQDYAYNGTGADGIAVTLSDYAMTAVPGAFGGSLGYAPKTAAAAGIPADIPGFNGGWIGVALDEFGNFQNPTEGRIGGPGATAQSVAIRASGAGVTGYRWLAGTAGLTPSIGDSASTVPSRGDYYQVIVDARNDPTSTAVTVNRDTGAGYTPLINIPNVYTAATALGFTQNPVPTNWQISFTGSTGGAANIHEIGGLRICAQTVAPPSGGTATGFSVIDEGYGTPPLAVQNYLTGHIYMKVVGTPFKLNVAALANSQIQTTYALGGPKSVTLKLVNNSDGACILDSSQANYCNATCTGKTAVTGGSQTMGFVAGDNGQKQSANFTLNSAYRNVVAIVSDGTVTACSTDAFSVRPASIASVTSSNATNTGSSGTPAFKAGGGNFSLTATIPGIAANPNGYTGVLKINNAAVQAVSPATWSGILAPTTFPAATSATSSSTATGNTFTYNEVGIFSLPGYNPATNTATPRSVFDGVATASECVTPVTAAQCEILKAATWTGIDSISAKGDCNLDNYSNTKDANGKYGCNFGNLPNTVVFGRFTPDHFGLSGGAIVNRADMGGGLGCTPASTYTYMGEPIGVRFTLTAMNAANGTTKNYAGAYANLSTSSWLTYGSANSVGLWMIATGYPVAPGACKAIFSNTTPSSTTFACVGVANPAPVIRTAGPRVSISGTPASPSWVSGSSTFAANVIFERADTPDGPYATLNIGVAPQDADGVTFTPAALDLDTDNNGSNERLSLGTTEARYGRLLIANTYGSELLGLPVKIRAQYWNGTSYATNTADNCTSLAAANFTVVQGAGATISTTVTGGGTMANGTGMITLNKPTNSPVGKGSVIVKSSAIAPATWPLNSYLPGSGIETFGVYKGTSVIYVREIY